MDKPERFLASNSNLHPPGSVSAKFEKKLSFMAPVYQVPNVSGDETSARRAMGRGFA